MERKYLGMDKNVCFGLAYLPFFIVILIPILLLATDKELTVDEKRMCVDVIANCNNVKMINCIRKYYHFPHS